jgi:hypothetical protein
VNDNSADACFEAIDILLGRMLGSPCLSKCRVAIARMYGISTWSSELLKNFDHNIRSKTSTIFRKTWLLTFREILRFNYSYYGHQTIYGIASAGFVNCGWNFWRTIRGTIDKMGRRRIFNAKFVNNANILNDHCKNSNIPAKSSRKHLSNAEKTAYSFEDQC